jgi:hypothetical protein
MEKKGHTVEFSKSTITERCVITTTSGMRHSALVRDRTSSITTEEQSEDMLVNYPELCDVIKVSRQCPKPLDTDILEWIEREYKESRGFELGTFNPSILSTLFQEQTSKWVVLAEGYISDSIQCVHEYIDTLMSALCSDRQIKSSLWSFMLDELINRYKKSVEHIRFILRTERQGTLLTETNRFSKNLFEARLARFMASVQVPLSLEKIRECVPIGNLEHTVGDIHNILRAYYEIARERFVDTVCIQGLDYHLLSGPATPLRVLTPDFIIGIKPEQLQMIAGEDTVSISRRATLRKEIDSLTDGRRLLWG